MVVDITSVPVLENMYNNTNRIEKDRGLFCFVVIFPKQVGRAAEY